MEYLDKIEMKSLIGMLRMDLKSCVKDENESWGRHEYESLITVLDEIESRCKGKFRSLDDL